MLGVIRGRQKFAGLTALLAVESTGVRGCITYMSLFIHVVQTDSCEIPYWRQSLAQCVWYYTHGKTSTFQSRFFHTAQVWSTHLALSNLSLLIDPVLLVLYHFTKCSLMNVLWIYRKREPGCTNVSVQCTGSGETNYTTNNNEIKVHKETVVTVKSFNMTHHRTRHIWLSKLKYIHTCIYMLDNELCMVFSTIRSLPEQ